LVDDGRVGRPKSTRNEVNIAAVADLVKNDRRIASRMIAEYLNIPKTVFLRILKEDLGKRNLCARFVPHFLTSEQRDDRVTSFQDIIAMTNADNIFLNKIITGDETWCFAYDPETKRKSSEWFHETSPSAEETEVPKVPHQDHVDNSFRLSRRSAQRIRTEGKKNTNNFNHMIIAIN
jgi:hypothetical protein